ncbi:PH domain leucine-rich repeat-containing protein phosphatase 1 [Electrophorus electricus]|uniref:PH domain leucine-rich repeat-containing protein phosphatase 1 n=1 Tax=Electrophorus electricus TaxID=8005 RepID=UPI0015D0A86D|nr:PH domain leucine-rich repeat-containing protein phosphatase 1 [Electrophorus electricus]
MESARAGVAAEGSSSVAGAWRSNLDGGGVGKFKKPSGLSVAPGRGVDGGGEAKPESGRQLTAPRVDVLKGSSRQSSAAAELNITNKSLVKTSKNGRSLTGNSNSLLLKRRRLKRNLSAASAATTAASVVPAGAGKMNSAPSSALHTRSLDRKTLLRHRQNIQLQPSDRQWIRADLHRGSIYVHDKLAPSYPRPVLCTLETTAGEVAQRFSQLSGKSGSVVRMVGKVYTTTDVNGNCNGEYTLSRDQFKPNANASAVRSRHGSPRHVVGTGGLPDRPSDRLRLLLLEKDHDGRHRDFDVNLFSPDTHPVVNILDNSLSDLNSNTNLTTPNDEDSIKRLTGTDSCGRNSGSDVESSAFDDLSSGARLSEHRDSLSDDMILGTDASVLSPTFDSATEGQDTYGSSSDELELDCPSSGAALDSLPQNLNSFTNDINDANNGLITVARFNDITEENEPRIDRVEPLGRASMPPSKSADSLSKAGLSAAPAASQPGNRPGTLEPGSAAEDDSAPALYVQLHGEAARRLGRDERPLQIQNDFLFKLGFKDPWRVQEEGMNTELGSVLRFYSGKPHSLESSERVQLSGTFNVRKGKLQLPVSRWSRRQVILCGTCLMVSSVKASHAGKMHILPLIGGKVEEVKKHSHCLAFSSAGPQSHTYYISFDSFTEHLRWHRHAAKMVSQRISSVDLSCCSLEKLPPNLLYSQDLTHLNLKHNFLPADPSLQQLQRFSRLRSLNLSNNQLGSFPLALSSISTLTELNLSCNCLSILHPSVGDMHNLQTLLLDGNLLWSLPAELGSLQRLVYLGLSFNRFTHVPQVLERLPAVERLCMAGNMLQQLPLQVFRLLPVKHVDLRLNQISVVVPDEPDFLRHVTQLDVRDNRLSELDASLFPRLEVLHCQRNRIARLQLRGAALKALYAANNEVHELEVKPAASNVTYVDISRNRLEVLPDWLSDSKKLEVLDVSHNCIRELPQWLFCSSSLRKVLVAHNALQRLPERVEWPAIEVLDIQHNQLVELPCNLFLKSDSLRCLNASANKLENLPPSSLSEESNSVLQELYLTNNHLTDKCVPLLTGHTHLRILHMAYNHLQTFPASKMAKLEELEEVDLSGNRLKSVPTTILNCKRMHTLIAHSNAIEVFPEAMQLMDMKCVDLSCNELVDITLPENLPPKLQELDLTGNPRLNLDHKTLEQLNNIRCFRIDPPPTSFSANEASGGPAVWSHGYTEASGVKNKLCVAALSVSSFCGSREALYGVFDGDRNVEVPYLLQCTMNDVLAEELHKTKSEEDYMTNTFLVMQRKLGTAGQKLGGSAVLCHIRHDPTDPAGCFTLTAANVGKCQAVLCRDGKALPLSLLHNIGLDEEYSRVRQHKAIITEDNKVNGVTDSTRIMGYSFLYPAVLPRPYVHTLPLTPRDEFFILGSRGLFESLEPDEAVEAVRKVPDALAAAKKLCTLAQAYGCTDSLSAVVVQLSVAEDCCCCCCSAAGGLHASTPQPPPSPGPGLYPPSSAAGVPPPSSCSEISSEVSASEMSSEVGSTASSDEPPVLVQEAHLLLLQQSHLPTLLQPNPRLLPCCSLHPTSAAPAAAGSFQRQLSGATFSGALSDNGLDSEDEEPIAGVFSNGSRVEVEADVHCLRFLAAPPPPPPCVPLAPDEAADPGPEAVPAPAPAEGDKEGNPAKQGETWSRSQVKRRGNGSVAPHERSHNLIEVATEVPSKKSGGYFTAPAQPDPDDQFIIPPELEEEVKEIMKQHQQEQLKPTKSEQPTDYYDTPL